MIGLLLLVLSVAGCGSKGTEVSEITTGEEQSWTWVELTDAVDTWLIEGEFVGESTGAFDSWTVPMLSGSEEITLGKSGVATEIKSLIEKRKTQPKDETKLTEEDIGLMEQIIQKIQDIGK